MFMSKESVLFVTGFCLVSISVLRSNEVEGSVNAGDPCSSTGPTCIENCRGRQNGYYQSCLGCSFFANCLAEILFYYNCYPGYVWDDNLKHCNASSSSCYCYAEPENCTTTGSRCIRSCKGLPDGDYQSCHGCSVYASCVGGKRTDYRPCAPANPPLQWDDISKRCNYTSRTCSCKRETREIQDELPWLEILKK